MFNNIGEVMKKHLIMLVLVALAGLLAAGTINLQSTLSQAQILSNSSEGLSVRFTVDAFEYQEVTTKEGVWTMLNAKDYTSTNRVGEPALPLMRKIISVPLVPVWTIVCPIPKDVCFLWRHQESVIHHAGPGTRSKVR
jgi:hypothetical protein